MVKRPKIKAESQIVGMKVLCFLHYRYANSENIVFTEEELSDQLDGISSRILHFTLETLTRENSINSEEIFNGHGDEELGHSISRQGINIVEAWDNKTYDEAAEGINFLDGEILAPASDRVVTLGDNSKHYKETIAALNEVIEEAEKSNEFGALFANSDDKVRAIAEMKQGVTLLEQTRVKVGAIKELIISNLQLIATKLPDAALGALAIKALEWLQKIIEAANA